MSLFSPLFIVGFTQARRDYLRDLAAELGMADAHIVTDGISGAIAGLQARGGSPGYILIDLVGHSGEIFMQLDQLAQHCEPKVRVVVMGNAPDLELRQALRARGVVDYLAQPGSAELRLALTGNAQPVVASGAKMQGMVVSCMSATAGDGGSSVAVNLASCLADLTGKPVVLVDMDYQFGLQSKNLELVAPFGVRELFEHPERGLDERLVSKMLVEYKPNMSLLAAPGELYLLPAIRPELIRTLLGILRERFTYVILDIPHVWTPWTAAALTYSQLNIMVGQLWLRSLTHAARLLRAWESVGIEKDDVFLVINRSGAKFKEAITVRDFERICRRPVDLSIPNDIKAITHAENQGKTLFEIPLDSRIRPQVVALAQKLIARNQPSPKTQGKPPADDKKGLLSRWVRK
jgi:pilus assembly protein CpaE